MERERGIASAGVRIINLVAVKKYTKAAFASTDTKTIEYWGGVEPLSPITLYRHNRNKFTSELNSYVGAAISRLHAHLEVSVTVARNTLVPK